MANLRFTLMPSKTMTRRAESAIRRETPQPARHRL